MRQKFILLIGGLGTRLREDVSDVPKPMADINGKPFLWYKLMQLKTVGFTNFVFLTGYMHEKIEAYFGNGNKFGVDIEYSVENEPLGTGGALKNAQKLIDGNFFMGNGDTYLDFNPNRLITGNKYNILSVHQKDGWINAGVYYFHKDIFGLIPEGKSSLERDIFPLLNPTMVTYYGYFIDIGTHDDYLKFIKYAKEVFK